jgi:nicotinamidase-related amidase
VSAALIVIDMLNPYDHEDAEPLKESVKGMVEPLRELIDTAREHDFPLVYVNDNNGDWSAGREQLIEAALKGTAPDLVAPIAPPAGTPFVVKARHSIFYETQLEYMLREQQIDRLVLAGQVTEQCVLYSALDGYVRHFEVGIARDCVAHIHQPLAEAALELMRTNMHAEICPGRQALESASGSVNPAARFSAFSNPKVGDSCFTSTRRPGGGAVAAALRWLRSAASRRCRVWRWPDPRSTPATRR